MFTAFGLAGLVQILMFYQALWIPPKFDFSKLFSPCFYPIFKSEFVLVMYAIAFSCEGLLFAFHNHPGGHSMLEV